MLTLKCPNCGSYNDDKAYECYFCHKELPSPDGKKRKKPRDQDEKTDKIVFTAPPPKKISRPGCLMVYIFLLFLTGAGGILYAINHAANLLAVSIPPEYLVYFGYWTDFLNGLQSQDAVTLVHVVVPLFVALFIFSLAFGLFLLQRWARGAVMLVQAILAATFALMFYKLLTMYYNPSNIPVEFAVVFLIILAGIFLSLYGFVWFFEKSRIFGAIRR
jgi:hypothetical protein